MRKAGLAALTTTAILAATAAIALAASAQPIVGGNAGMNVFGDPSGYTLTGGSVATLSWNSGGPHNATATTNGPDGKPLFRSATISSGTTPVDGTQYLQPGSYSFFCTVHGSAMSSSLIVSGTPLPRPTVTVKVLTKTLSAAAKGKLKIKVTTTGSGTIDLTAALGAKTIGTGSIANVVPGSANGVIKLTKSGKSALAKKSSAKIGITAAIDFAGPVTTKAKLK